MDRLKKLLDAHPVAKGGPKDTQGLSREAERTQLNTADARFNKQVYQNEIRQADLYEQSQMPPTPQDVGVSFKIGSFVNKLSQLLGFKTDIYGQLNSLLSIGQPINPARLLKDARLISLATDYFKMVDIIATYNELTNYITLYAPQMKVSSDFASGINNTYLLPLIQLLKQTAELYASSFNVFPTGRELTGENRQAYERFRKASSSSYSTVMLMSENLNNAIYTSLTTDDIKRYEASKQILTRIFGKNPEPVIPILPPPLPVQPILPPLDPNAPQQPVGPQPAPPAPVGQAPSALEILRAYNTAKLQTGVPQADMFSRTRLGTQSALMADILAFARDTFGETFPPRSANFLKQALGTIREEIRQQGQQAGPAPAPLPQPAPAQPVARQFTPQQQAYLDAGGTDGAIGQLPNLATLTPAQNEEVWTIYRRLENEQQPPAVIPPTQAGARLLWNALPQDIQNTIRRPNPQEPTGFDIDEAEAINADLIPWIQGIQQLRVAWGQQNNTPSNELWGLGATHPQRAYLEDRRRLAELARGDPRTVDMSQGRREREIFMPFINELDPKAEFLKRRGQVLTGGVDYNIHDNINDILPYETYGGNVDYDDAEENTPFKRRIGMPNPFAPQSKVDTLPIRPVFASNATDLDETLLPFQQMFSTVRSGHEKEKEKPKDMDEDPDPIRITNENYKIFTGRQKAPKYKISS
jgi:hypothetical protein